MKARTLAEVLFTAALFLVLAYAMTGYPEFGFVRPLGGFFLYHTFNEGNPGLWSGSPNAVTGILWDYRGYDTLFETMVFYIGTVAVVIFFERRARLRQTRGMSMIVSASTRLIFIFIITSALTITIFSVKGSGGGFQGGSIMAIAYVAILVALSKGFLPQLKINVKRAHLLRTLGLTIIAAMTLTPIVFSIATGTEAFALQNQAKEWAPFGFPAFLGLRSLSGGSIIPIQIGETLFVGMGFTIMFTLLTLKGGDEDGDGEEEGGGGEKKAGKEAEG